MLNISRIKQQDLKMEIDNIMVKYPALPKEMENIMSLFGDLRFSLGLMTGLLVLTEHRDIPVTLTSEPGNIKIISLLESVKRALQEHEEKSNC